MKEPPAIIEIEGVPCEVAYISDGFARGPKGLCAFCGGDPCNEHSPPDSTIAEFYKANPHASTCPCCEGRPS